VKDVRSLMNAEVGKADYCGPKKETEWGRQEKFCMMDEVGMKPSL